jgi:L-serine dehydratase
MVESHGIFGIMGPVMVGPSSSHTAGALRLARLAREVFGGQPAAAVISLHGSFAKTGRGHGTHLALVAGLLGMAVDDTRLPAAMAMAAAAGLEVTFVEVDLGPDAHPNTAVFDLSSPGRKAMRVAGASLGGGLVRLAEINGFPVSVSGALDALVVAHHDTPGIIARLCSVMALYDVNIAGMNVSRRGRGGEALTVLELDTPCPEPVCQCIAGSPQVAFAARIGRLDPAGGEAAR